MTIEPGPYALREMDAVIPPGEVLDEELETRKLSQQQLATMMSRPVQVINEIIHGRKAITARTAVELEKALGIPAELWLRLEASYRLALERRRLQESA